MEDNFERDYGMVILELLQALKEKLALILAVTILAGLLGWAVSAFIMPRKYEASVNMIVNSRTDLTTMVTSDNISTSRDLVDTYAIIIKSNKVLNQVIDQLDLDMTYEEISNMISVDAIRSTQVMKIAALCREPEQAVLIVRTIAEVAPSIVADAVEAGSCKVVSDVYTSSKPVSPDIPRNVLICAVLAFLAVCGLVVLNELFRDYIVDDADLEKKLGISVLGVIPDVEE